MIHRHSFLTPWNKAYHWGPSKVTLLPEKCLIKLVLSTRVRPRRRMSSSGHLDHPVIKRTLCSLYTHSSSFGTYMPISISTISKIGESTKHSLLHSVPPISAPCDITQLHLHCRYTTMKLTICSIKSNYRSSGTISRWNHTPTSLLKGSSVAVRGSEPRHYIL